MCSLEGTNKQLGVIFSSRCLPELCLELLFDVRWAGAVTSLGPLPGCSLPVYVRRSLSSCLWGLANFRSCLQTGMCWAHWTRAGLADTGRADWAGQTGQGGGAPGGLLLPCDALPTSSSDTCSLQPDQLDRRGVGNGKQLPSDVARVFPFTGPEHLWSDANG